MIFWGKDFLIILVGFSEKFEGNWESTGYASGSGNEIKKICVKYFFIYCGRSLMTYEIWKGFAPYEIFFFENFGVKWLGGLKNTNFLTDLICERP